MSCYYIVTLSSFVQLLGRIWDPKFTCPDLEPVTTPSEEDQEYLDGLVEQQ